ncbi:MAG: S-methyl-5'-thioadenosine phosphorylase [Silvanigrellales bacterium]|jgi:5'-methylthioadenosine phosphorylase|nr:S-methyl-5'-thioadenosine phosphorylase [Silvanigrellales bacterium]
MKTSVGIIGGSGLYDMEGLTNVQERRLETPFGSPSDVVVTGELAGKPVAFLPRHGRGHRFLPTEVNYRANIYALKSLGVTHIVSVSAVGSLQERHAPGGVVIPTQILDRTNGARERTFFGKGVVGHVSLADPYCPELQAVVHKAALKEIPSTTLGGTYVCVEGPRFSSRAESHSFRALEADIIGMTAMPEAILAREAELPYTTLAFVTDYDCWKESEDAVSVEAVLAVLKKNVDASKRIVRGVVEALPAEVKSNPIYEAAKFAIMTPKELIPHETKRALDLLYGKYWR